MNRNARGLATLLMLAGCGGPSEPVGPTFSVVDSAGIEIVTSHAPAWTSRQAWRVSNRPSLTIGELDGPLEFTFGNVRAVGELSDGRYFVGDEQAHTIRIFSSGGDYLESVGREGEGPGELQWFLTVSRYRTDSLFVYDYLRRAVSVFSPELSFVRRFTNPLTLSADYWITSALSDGRFLLYSTGSSGRSERRGLIPDSSWVVLSEPDGSAVDTIGAFQVRTRYIGAGGRAEPLHLEPHATIVGEGDRILIAEGEEFEFTEFGLDGNPRRITRKTHQPVPVTADVLADYKAWYVERLSDSPEGVHESAQRSLDEGHYPDELPAVAAVKIDALGYVWVGTYHYPGQDTEEWEVFDSAGVWLGTVETPPGLQVHEIGVDRIIGVAMDDFDVAYLRVHRLDRR